MKELERLKADLEKLDVGQVWLNEPLKNHTTIKVGGPADLFIQPRDKEGLVQALNILRQAQVPWFVIGRGSNLLVRDGGIRGAVIKLGKGLDTLTISNEWVTVGAGFSMIKLATIVAQQGLSGLEFAGGIPGTVGGAVFMNAGAHGSDISSVLVSAQVLYQDGQIKELSKEELHFGYRTSSLQREPKGICLEATFELKKGDKEEIMRHMAQNKEYRRKTQPLQEPCCGSVFRNPKPHSSGRLIEQAGLKGYRVGDAQVSTKHANFIVNLGNARASDVLALIRHIQETVYSLYGIQLKPEVEIVGED